MKLKSSTHISTNNFEIVLSHHTDNNHKFQIHSKSNTIFFETVQSSNQKTKRKKKFNESEKNEV